MSGDRAPITNAAGGAGGSGGKGAALSDTSQAAFGFGNTAGAVAAGGGGGGADHGGGGSASATAAVNQGSVDTGASGSDICHYIL
jgi:hypothetical protein